MAKGFGNEYFEVLDKMVIQNPAKGIFIRDLRRLTEYHITKNKLDIRYASSMFTPLTEMYLVSKMYNHTFNHNREGVFVSGIGYSKPEVRELVETLALGLGQSPESASEATKLYNSIYGIVSV